MGLGAIHLRINLRSGVDLAWKEEGTKIEEAIQVACSLSAWPLMAWLHVRPTEVAKPGGAFGGKPRVERARSCEGSEGQHGLEIGSLDA